MNFACFLLFDLAIVEGLPFANGLPDLPFFDLLDIGLVDHWTSYLDTGTGHDDLDWTSLCNIRWAFACGRLLQSWPS